MPFDGCLFDHAGAGHSGIKTTLCHIVPPASVSQTATHQTLPSDRGGGEGGRGVQIYEKLEESQ